LERKIPKKHWKLICRAQTTKKHGGLNRRSIAVIPFSMNRLSSPVSDKIFRLAHAASPTHAVIKRHMEKSVTQNEEKQQKCADRKAG
jgi:hypothetical protein